MENTLLNRSLYAEAVCKLQAFDSSSAVESDATWEDCIELYDATDMSEDDAKASLQAFDETRPLLRAHSIGRLGQRGDEGSPLRAIAAHSIGSYYLHSAPKASDLFAHRDFIASTTQTYARLDDMEGVHGAASHIRNESSYFANTYAKCAQAIGTAQSEKSLDCARQLIDIAPTLRATAEDNEKNAKHPQDVHAYFLRIFAGAYRRLYQENPHGTIEHVQTQPGEHLLGLIDSLQELGQEVPERLLDQAIEFSRQREATEAMRLTVVRQHLKAKRYTEALEIPAPPKGYDGTGHYNPRKRLLLHHLYTEGKFEQAQRLVGTSVGDGPDRADLRSFLIDTGDIALLRQYNRADNGYVPRADEVQIHVRRGDIQAANQVVADMPPQDTSAGYRTIAQEMLAADPTAYTIEDMHDFCMASVIASRRQKNSGDPGWTHSRIFGGLVDSNQFAEAEAFRRLATHKTSLSADELASFNRHSRTTLSRLYVRQGRFAEAMHGDHLPTQGIGNLAILLAVVGGLQREVLGVKGRNSLY